MKNATLRQLKVFEAVARHLSFTRAAEKLHLTQAGAEMLRFSRTIIEQFRDVDQAMHVSDP